MAINRKQQTITLVVHIWAEYLYESPPKWRGVVKPMHSGNEIHFTEFSQIADLIREETQFTIKKEELF